MPQKHRVRNWSSYTQSLVKRGDLFLYFDENFLKNEWLFRGTRKSGGQVVYSNAAIEMFLSIKNLMKLPFRQTQGFIASILKKLEISVQLPDFTTVSRRAKTLQLQVKSFGVNRNEPVHVLIDSTGMSLYSAPSFHTSRYHLC